MRAFCAIPIDDHVRSEVVRVQQRLAAELPDVRWSRADNLHLTLRFFGDIEAESLEKAAKVMLSVGALGSSFTLPLLQLGAFPTTSRPRVLWLGFEDSVAMRRLHERFEGLLASVGLPPGPRSFSPHLTLGRARKRLPDITPLLQRCSRDIQGALPVERIVFYQSRLLPHGAEHTPLHTIELNGSQY